MPTSEEMVKALRDQQEWAIINHGWAVQYVFDPEGNNPSFLYTIGLARHGLPEILVIGNLSPETLGTLANGVAAQMYQNKETKHVGVELDSGMALKSGGSLRIDLHQIQNIAKVRNDYIIGSVVRWGNAVNCVQLIWGDDKNVLPTEPGYNTEMVQPLL